MTWEVQPRAADLSRDFDPVVGWSELQVTERWPGNDTWTLTGPWSALAVLGVPGMGCILDRHPDPDPDDDPAADTQVTSGRLWRRERWIDTDTGQLRARLSFVQDSVGGRIVYPDGTHALSSTPSTFSRAYDGRTLTIESLILGYIRSNLADLALADRRLANLVLPVSQQRGGVATVNGRFDNLGLLVQDLAEAGRLRVRLVHDETVHGQPRLALRIDEVPDVSADVRFGLDSGLGVLTDYRDTITAPEVTHAIVAGGGELADRILLEVADAAAVARWGGIRMEQLVDQRQTIDAAELTAAGVKALAAGATPTVVQIGVADGPDIKWRRQYGPGYLVGIDGPDGPADDIVREAVTTVTVDDDGAAPEAVTIVVGSPGASAIATDADRVSDATERRIELLERTT